MSTSVTPRLLLVAIVAVGSVLLSAPAAHACSCALQEPAEMIATHDAGFIGEVAAVRGAGWGQRTWTFEVQRWVKGDLGPTVTVSTPASGASCGFELELGDEAAILLHVEGGVATSGLCSTLDADAVRAYLDPPKPSPGRRATTLVAGGSGGDYLWLFDDRGGLVASQANTRRGELVDLSVCPGGERVVEAWDRRVVVRSLAGMRPLRTVAVPEDLRRVWCSDRKGREVLGARADVRSGDWRSIVSLAALNEPLARGAWVNVEVVGDHLLATVGWEHTELWLVSLVSGETARLHVASDETGVALNVEPSIEGFAVSPDDQRVAFEVTRYPAEGRPSSEVFVYGIAAQDLMASASFDVEGSEVRWLDESRVVLTSYEHAPLVLRADDLSVQTRLPAEASWVAAATPDGALVGMDGPRLSAVMPTTGEISVLSAVPAQFTGWFQRLPRPLRVSATAQRTSKQRAAAQSVSSAAGSAVNPSGRDDPGDGARRGILLAGATAATVLTGLVWARRRRRPLAR
ncbi:MAG: hypothetical protein H0V19_08230 [Euzebyales bacterium]|nr:hypothetical protein [Euzebyales bacterium]